LPCTDQNKVMKRFAILMLLFFTAVFHSFSQSFIKGMVKDSNGAAVAFCPLALMNAADSSIIKGNVSNENGEFIFSSLAKGAYIIKISATGFADYFSETVVVDSLSQIDLGTFSLKNSVTNLKEVSISAIRPAVEFKNGVVVLNVENNILATGNTVLELLKRIPGVSVDAQNNVMVNGKSGVRFMIDGKLQQQPAAQVINMLGNMSSESVSTVELIKNPPAKYDAAGTGALINIVIKKAKLKGFNGSISESAGYGKRFGSGTGVSLNFKSDRLSVFSNINYMNKDFLEVITSERTLTNPSNAATFLSGGDMETFKSSLDVTAGLEYDLSPKTTAGLNFTGNINASKTFRNFNTSIEAASAVSNLQYITIMDDEYKSPALTVYAVHTFDTAGTSLSFSADYTNFLYTDPQQNNSYSFDEGGLQTAPMLGYKSDFRLDFNIYTQKLDFTKFLTKTLQLETGLKSSLVENNSSSSLQRNMPGTEEYAVDPTFNNVFNYKEKIFAAYVNFIKTWEKISLQTGVRAEQTMIAGQSKISVYGFKRGYLNFFPNVSLDYKASEKKNFQFSYSYRIDRPGYEQLNSARIFVDQLTCWSGNPELKPQYSHNFNLEYNYNNTVSNSISYVHVDNSIYNYSYTPDSSQLNIDTVFNFSSRNMLAYTLFVQKQFAQWYSLQFSGTFAYFNSVGNVNGANGNAEAFAFKISVNNDFMLPKGFKLQLNANGSSPFRDGIQLYSGRASLDVAIQQRFMQNKLSVSLGLYDILYTDFVTMRNSLPGQTYTYTQKSDTRRVRLNISYRFGNMRIARKINTGNEESQRIKKAK